MYVLSEQVAVNFNQDCCIILNLNTSVYYIFDLTALSLIDLISKGINSLEKIVEYMCNEYEVDTKQMYNDAKQFLDKCVEHGLIVEKED